MNQRPGFMRLGQLEEERADAVGGYQITISLSKDFSFGVLQRMPDGKQHTIASCDLQRLLCDLQQDPSQVTLHKWFELKTESRR